MAWLPKRSCAHMGRAFIMPAANAETSRVSKKVSPAAMGKTRLRNLTGIAHASTRVSRWQQAMVGDEHGHEGNVLLGKMLAAFDCDAIGR